MEISNIALSIAIVALFMYGVMIGHMISEREDPHAPKPKNWYHELMAEWEKGYHAGRRSAFKSMKGKIDREAMLNEYRKEHDSL